MRATTSAQDTALAATDRRTSVRVKMEDPDGVMQDIGDLSSEDFFDALTISANVDSPVSSATLTLWRAAAALSLAPLMEGSTLNRSGSTYAPFLDVTRAMTVEIATMLAGQTPSSSDWVMLWEGYVDDIDWAGERIEIQARDPMGRLNDTIIETITSYGGGSPLADIEDVMQSILNDAMGSGEYPLVVVGTPDFGVKPYELGNVSVLDALTALADLQGWNLHWKWDATASPEDFFLTYYEPVRNAVDLSGYSPDFTFGTDDYYGVQQLQLSSRGIRNAGEVAYTDTAGTDASVAGSRSSSVAKYDRRFIRLDERGGSISTSAQATAMLNAVLDDLEVPRALQRIEAAFHWPIELGDMHRYQANGVHYDVDQDWAVRGYTHVLEPTRVRTLIDVAGKPAGGYSRWHKREATKPERQTRLAMASIQVAFDSSGVAIVSASGASETENIYITVGDGSEPEDPTPTTNDGTINGRSGTVDTGVAVSAGNDAWVKAVASSGGAFGAVSQTRVTRSVGSDSAGDGIDVTAGQISLDIVDLTLDAGPMDAGDSLAFHDDGVGTRRILPGDIPVSLFQNDAGYTVGGIETASTGLTTVGSDVQVDYAGGAGSLIGAAADGTGLGTLGTSDRVLFADFSDSFNVKFAAISQLPFETNLTAGAGLGRSGDTLSVNVGDGIQIASDAVALDLVDLVLTATNPDRTADHLVFNDASAPDAPRRILFQNVGLSVFDNDAGFSADALETAGAGLIESPAGTVAVDYSGTDNFILAATGGALSSLAGADKIAVNDATDNIVHEVALADLESFLSIGASQITAGTFGAGDYVFPAGSDVQIDGGNAWSTGASVEGTLGLSHSAGTAGQGNFGASVTFPKIGSGVNGGQRAAIVLRQEGGDDDACSLAFFAHPSSTAADPVEEIVQLGGGGVTDAFFAGPVRIGGDTDTGLTLPADGTLGFEAAGALRLDLDAIDATHGRFAFQNGQVHTVEGAEITRGTAGAVTLDWDAYNSVDLRNDGNIDTINIDDGSMQDGNTYTLVIRYATSGQTSITFSATGTLQWQFGSAPTLPTATLGDRTVITFVKTGGITLGFYADAPA